MPLDATAHFRQDFNNAFWDGERMAFGDGDLFNRFTISLDVIGHELTHGVMQHEAELMNFFQSGALNESMSDVFGSLIKQYVLKQTADQADWLIGTGLFTDKVKGIALRSPLSKENSGIRWNGRTSRKIPTFSNCVAFCKRKRRPRVRGKAEGMRRRTSKSFAYGIST